MDMMAQSILRSLLAVLVFAATSAAAPAPGTVTVKVRPDIAPGWVVITAPAK
jgi:hypothetical protein